MFPCPKKARRPDGRLNFQLNKPLLWPLRNKILRLIMLKYSDEKQSGLIVLLAVISKKFALFSLHALIIVKQGQESAEQPNEGNT